MKKIFILLVVFFNFKIVSSVEDGLVEELKQLKFDQDVELFQTRKNFFKVMEEKSPFFTMIEEQKNFFKIISKFSSEKQLDILQRYNSTKKRHASERTHLDELFQNESFIEVSRADLARLLAEDFSEESDFKRRRY